MEETNIESMDTMDASDSETITLTRNKVWFVYCMSIERCIVGCLECYQCHKWCLYAGWRSLFNGKDPKFNVLYTFYVRRKGR